jgi:hypothetical protein
MKASLKPADLVRLDGILSSERLTIGIVIGEGYKPVAGEEQAWVRVFFFGPGVIRSAPAHRLKRLQ